MWEINHPWNKEPKRAFLMRHRCRLSVTSDAGSQAAAGMTHFCSLRWIKQLYQQPTAIAAIVWSMLSLLLFGESKDGGFRLLSRQKSTFFPSWDNYSMEQVMPLSPATMSSWNFVFRKEKKKPVTLLTSNLFNCLYELTLWKSFSSSLSQLLSAGILRPVMFRHPSLKKYQLHKWTTFTEMQCMGEEAARNRPKFWGQEH